MCNKYTKQQQNLPFDKVKEQIGDVWFSFILKYYLLFHKWYL